MVTACREVLRRITGSSEIMAGHRRKCQPVRAVIPEGETRQGFVSERRPFPDRVCVAEHSAFGAGASLSRLGVAGGCIAEVGAQRALPSRGLRSEPWQAGAGRGGGCWSACGAGAAQASRVPPAAYPACPGAKRGSSHGRRDGGRPRCPGGAATAPVGRGQGRLVPIHLSGAPHPGLSF